MPTNSNLLNIDGSVMLPVPLAILEQLDLRAGSPVELSVDRGRLIVKSETGQPSYTLDELLAQSDVTAPLTDEDRDWLSGGPVGKELV